MSHEVWQKNESILEHQYPELHASLIERGSGFWDMYPDVDASYYVPEDKDRFIEREVAFVDKIVHAVDSLSVVHEGPLTLLLDVDETFILTRYHGDSGTTSHIRPALQTLLEVLDDRYTGRYDVGLLTSRAQSHLDDEMAKSGHGIYGHIGERLNPKFVVSSRPSSPIFAQEELRRTPLSMVYGHELDNIRAMDRIVRPEVKAMGESIDQSVLDAIVTQGYWYDMKLPVLQYLADTNPDRGFVFVDDMPFPAMVDPAHPQVRGVALGAASFYM